MQSDPEVALRRWLAGETDLDFETVDHLRQQLLQLHGQQDGEIPHTAWWKGAVDSTQPGWVYRKTGDELIRRHELVAPSALVDPNQRGTVWRRWAGLPHVKKYRIHWGRRSYAYVQENQLALLIPNQATDTCLLPDGQQIDLVVERDTLSDGGALVEQFDRSAVEAAARDKKSALTAFGAHIDESGAVQVPLSLGEKAPVHLSQVLTLLFSELYSIKGEEDGCQD